MTSTVPTKRAKIVMLWPQFPPSVMSGGPPRSAAGMLSALSNDFEISVITSAFDGRRSSVAMEGVAPDRWCDVFGASAWYTSERRPHPFHLLRLIRGRDPHLVYLNSLWHFRFSILPLLALRAGKSSVPVLIAPRGELSVGALRIRPWRKRLVILLYRFFRISHRVAWHASTEMERADIHRVFGATVTTHVAVDLRNDLRCSQRKVWANTGEKKPPSAVFLSRITPKKNLDGLLHALSLVNTSLQLTIAGPVADRDHWTACEHLIGRLPSTIRVRVNGPVPPNAVVEFLSGFDLFLLPTHGENYGHAILEALAAGLPVIVGSSTPWKRVEEENAGWLVDSNSPTELARLIERFAGLTQAERESMSQSACRLASAIQRDTRGVEANRQMFLDVSRAANGPNDIDG